MEPYRDIALAPLSTAHQRPTSFTTTQTSYSHDIPDGPRDEEDQEELLRPEQRPEKPHIAKTFLIQTFAFLWLVPILLFLNIRHHIIGASAWCPFGRCLPYVHDLADDGINPRALPAKYERQSRNLLGGLQFVAKTLEVWFILIATWLVYLTTMFVASKQGGIPVGYLSRPSEFAEVPSLFDPLLWTTLRRVTTSRSRPRVARKRIFMFIAATVFLCFICNLIGPAVAVLVLPTLQWIDTDKHGNTKLGEINSDVPPDMVGRLLDDSGCGAHEAGPGNFSCARKWATSLNGWSEGYFARQTGYRAVSAQGLLAFSYNVTGVPLPFDELVEVVTWAPSRRVVQDLSDDYRVVRDISEGQVLNSTELANRTLREQYASYVPLNNTVQTLIYRNGPVLGAIANAWVGYDNNRNWTIEAGHDRAIKCYAGYDVSNTPMCWDHECSNFVPSGNYTRCISIGAGWNGYKNASFGIDRYWKEAAGIFSPYLNFTIHVSPRVAFFLNGKPPGDISEGCLDGTINPGQCDWEKFFELSDDPNTRLRSRDVTTWEIVSNPRDTTVDHPNVTALTIDFTAYQSLANYTLDPSFVTNPLYTAEFTLTLDTDSSMSDVRQIHVDPAWSLAAWGVEEGTNLASTESRAISLLRTFTNLWETENYQASNPALTQWKRLDATGLIPILQMLSLIDYSEIETIDTQTTDFDHPLLQRYAKIYVWAYGLGTRTSYMGAIVCSIGCLVVIAEIIIGFLDRRRFRSTTQMLVAALEHKYADEFQGHSRERHMSRVSFRLDNDDNKAGKYRFERVV